MVFCCCATTRVADIHEEPKALSGQHSLKLAIDQLKGVSAPVQKELSGVAAVHFGLGSNAPANLGLRKRIGVPGPPFGGLGFFDPQKNAELAGDDAPPAHCTAEFVRTTKLQEFKLQAEGSDSMYFWALQPIFDTQDNVIAAEILVRAKNGYDGAPFEDVQAIMDPMAPADVQHVYKEWKATEMVEWPLHVLKDFPVLRHLEGIASNVRPLDLRPETALFQEVLRRLKALSQEDRALLCKHLVVEVTEDQDPPDEALQTWLKAWQDLGFRLAFDDTIGELACRALSKEGVNFHTTRALSPLLEHFGLLKVDIEWAGFALFLSHPAYSSRATVKQAVLNHARDEDLVYVPQGPGLQSTSAKHSALLREFATWGKEMIANNKCLYIELSVSQQDESNVFALRQLKEMGLDIFGEHKAHFRFQGGPTGAKAFEPAVMAASAEANTTPA